VLQADGHRFGLIVDRINDTEEIVVKPLDKHLKGIPAFAGATIMGDGRIALILDVLGLAQQANVVGRGQDRSRAKRAGETEAPERPKQTLLLFSLSDGRPVAVPLSMVARLEMFDAARVETLADYRVVQYRGEVLPLLDIEALMGSGAGPWGSEGPLHVVVHGDGKRHVGLVVQRIVDVVEEHLDVKQPTSGRSGSGVLGCAVIQKRVTELLDLDAMLRLEAGRFLDPESAAAGGREG
jgi:two-component system chemotaxis sensor kinase CheA